MIPGREIYFNVQVGTILALYVLLAVPAGLLAYALARRVRAWRRGRAEPIEHSWARAAHVAKRVLLHAKIVRRRNLRRGLTHFALFYGFTILLAGTLLVMVESDIAVPLFGRGFLHGSFYLGFKLAMNVAGLLLIGGVLFALHRRLAVRPAHLETTRDDLLILAFLLLLPAQGYVLQALRLAYTHDPWAAWSFVSYPLAAALATMPESALIGWHRACWHAHFLTAFAFFGYVGWSKMVHPFTAIASVYFGPHRPHGELPPIPDLEQAEVIGAAKLEHYGWTQLMSLDACTHCGRCLDYCPTANTGKALRPRDLVLELAGYQSDSGGLFTGVLGEAANAGRFRAGRGAGRELVGGVVSEEEVWACTTCGSCMEECPVDIRHVPLIVDMRRNLVTEENRYPPELNAVFTSLERLGNPYQGMPKERGAWTKKAGVPVPELSEVKATGKAVEYLFFVGCLGSFVPKNQATTIAVARILHEAGIGFAILGKEERCHGDPARRMGHEFLARQLAAKTVEQFDFYGVKKIVTACAHCFNAIRNEFPQLGGRYEVVHHSQLIAELVAAGRIPLEERARENVASITYHDPCYLGRHNGVFDDPRAAIGAAVKVPIAEMPRSRERSFCCGGGGGRAFMKEQSGARINRARAAEALGTGARVVATACPYCAGMLEDGIVAENATTRLRVVDIAELVADAMKERTEETIPPAHADAG